MILLSWLTYIHSCTYAYIITFIGLSFCTYHLHEFISVILFGYFFFFLIKRLYIFTAAFRCSPRQLRMVHFAPETGILSRFSHYQMQMQSTKSTLSLSLSHSCKNAAKFCLAACFSFCIFSFALILTFRIESYKEKITVESTLKFVYFSMFGCSLSLAISISASRKHH